VRLVCGVAGDTMEDVSYAPPRVVTLRGDIAMRMVFAVVEQDAP